MSNDRKEIFENRINKQLPRYLTSSELAEVLGVSVHTIRSWRKFRIIKPVTFGRSVRWLLDDVVKELSTKRNKT